MFLKEHDFLAGLLGEILTGSIIRLAVPIPFPTRSQALEYSWERA